MTTGTVRLSHQRQTKWYTIQPLRTRHEHAALSVDIHVLCERVAQRIVFSRQMYIWPNPIEIFPLVSHFEVRRLGRVYDAEEQNEHPNQFHDAYGRKPIDDLGRDTDRLTVNSFRRVFSRRGTFRSSGSRSCPRSGDHCITKRNMVIPRSGIVSFLSTATDRPHPCLRHAPPHTAPISLFMVTESVVHLELDILHIHHATR